MKTRRNKVAAPSAMPFCQAAQAAKPGSKCILFLVTSRLPLASQFEAYAKRMDEQVTAVYGYRRSSWHPLTLESQWT